MLNEGWDGNNARPVSAAVISNMRDVLNKCEDKDIESWVLFPDVNGNLYLDFKSDEVDAGLILAETSFSYFADDKDGKDIPFSSATFLQVMDSINAIVA